MARRVRLILAATLITCFSSVACALPQCYMQAMAPGDNRIPAHQWLAQTQDQRNSAGHLWVVSAQDGHTCSAHEMLPGGIRIVEEPFMVPYGFLYELFAHAVAQGDKQKVVFLATHARPAAKGVDALLNLYDILPPPSAGGWATFETLAAVFQMKLERSRWINFGLLGLYRVMGGQGIHDCKTHRLPDKVYGDVANVLGQDILVSAVYGDILEEFGLSVGRVTINDDRGSEQLTLILEGCIE